LFTITGERILVASPQATRWMWNGQNQDFQPVFSGVYLYMIKDGNEKKTGKLTEVSFDVDFELKNKFLNILMSKSFKYGLDKIADAFQKRAEELFNNR